MKKNLKLMILIPAIAIVVVLGLVAAKKLRADSNDFTINNNRLLKYTGTATDVVVPLGVEEIGAEAFSGNPMVVSVEIPEGVKTIGNSAFAGCMSLTSVKLPDSLESIDDSAFASCPKLNDVRIGQSLNKLGTGVFANCGSLKGVTINPANQCFISSDGALFNGDKTYLYQYFAGDEKQIYNMPSQVKDIGRYAFWGCNNLREVNLSANLDKIPQYAFYASDALESITIYEPCREICLGAFQNCGALRQVICPISLSEIHNNAFDGCSDKLTFVCDKDSKIKKYADSMGIPTTDYPEYKVVVRDEEQKDDNGGNDIVSEFGFLQDKIPMEYENEEERQDILMGNSTVVSDKVYIMVDGFNVIDGTDATSYIDIEDYDYYRDDSFTVFDFSNVKNIGMLAFARSGLCEIKLPDTVKTIGYGAFYHCDHLRNINIPGSVERIGAYAFEHTPWYQDWLENADGVYLVVGDGVLYSYKGNDSDITIPGNVKYICANAFAGHSEIESVKLSNPAVTIAPGAFDDCTGLATVTGADSSTVIEDDTIRSALE